MAEPTRTTNQSGRAAARRTRDRTPNGAAWTAVKAAASEAAPMLAEAAATAHERNGRIVLAERGDRYSLGGATSEQRYRGRDDHGGHLHQAGSLLGSVRSPEPMQPTLVMCRRHGPDAQ